MIEEVIKDYAKDGSTVINYQAKINGAWYSVPLDPANRQYAEIMQQVKEGTLTIKDAE
jgi:transglutaminase/protease-like cytokinesis protein 3